MWAMFLLLQRSPKAMDRTDSISMKAYLSSSDTESAIMEMPARFWLG